MAHSTQDEDAKVLARIKTLLEEEMKEKMMENFLQTMLKNQGSTSSSTQRGSTPKCLFVDALYEQNAKSFQKYHQEDKQRTLTLSELSHQIQHLKKEILGLKNHITVLESRKEKNSENISLASSRVAPPTKNPKIEIF